MAREDDEDLVGGDGRRVAKTDNQRGETEAQGELRAFIERIERLEEEKAGIMDDIKEVIGEAKGRGYDTKAIRTIVKIRKQDAEERAEEESILDTYLIALGMAPLGGQ
jgi:uncharacterized protein (UPF0335 family)